MRRPRRASLWKRDLNQLSVTTASWCVAAGRRPSGRLELRPRHRAPLQLAVMRPALLDGSVEREPPVVQHRRARAERLRRVDAVRDEAERHPGRPEVADARLALLLEALVA